MLTILHNFSAKNHPHIFGLPHDSEGNEDEAPVEDSNENEPAIDSTVESPMPRRSDRRRVQNQRYYNSDFSNSHFICIQ